MKRIIALAAAILLAMTFAWAEEAPGSALTLYEELLRQEATAALELEIVRLERQVAQIQGDSAALAAADAREEEILARQAEIAQAVNDLGLPLVRELSERIAALDAENARLEEQQAAIRAAMADNDRLRKEYAACREEYVKAHAESASAKGFAADVTVRIFRDETGAVAYLQVDAPWETPGIGSRCTEEAFTGQFIGKTGPFVLDGNVDAVSGGTRTSRAVVEALNQLYPEMPVSEMPVLPHALTASAKGLLSDVQVWITLDDGGAIDGIWVDCSGETEAIARPCTEEAFLSQFIGKTGPLLQIDAVAGATYTSCAVIDAVNSLFTDTSEGAEAE